MIQRFLFACELKGDVGLKAVLSEYSLADAEVLDELLEKSVKWENSIPRSDPELLFAQFRRSTDDVSLFMESLCRCVEKRNELPGQNLGDLKSLDVEGDVAVAEFAFKKSRDPASTVQHPGIAKEQRRDPIIASESHSLEIRSLVHLRRIDGAWYVADAEEVGKERRRVVQDSAR
ncbi:MAG: hypothetical protein GXX96_10460 [Planctomycetaceae bacterium]|nr:hypothetical protein [Planctomycetaceae bacterium]